jgi:hypothetical protein
MHLIAAISEMWGCRVATSGKCPNEHPQEVSP